MNDASGASGLSSPQAFAVFFGAVLALAVAPGLLAGLAAGALLRRRGLRFGWALLGVPGALALGWFTLPQVVDDLAGFAEGASRGEAGLVDGLAVAWPAWVALAPPAAAGWMFWREHRDRLRGGHAAETLALRHGPWQALQRRRHNAQHGDNGIHSADGVAVGLDERGWQARVPILQAHATIVGGSNTGKTNTAAVLLEGHVAGGAGFLILDGKGGRDLPRAALELGRRYGRPVALWSVRPYGDPELDALRLAWNVTGDGDPTEIKDRIASSEEQTEPYYAAIASRGLLAASRALTQLEGHVRLDDLARLLDNQDAMKAALRNADPDGFADELGWLANLTDGERSGLRGMAIRLRTMIASDGGQWLLPDADGREISLYRAIADNWLTVFTLPQGTYPELIPHVAKYALQAINGVCTRIEGEGRQANCVVFVDELSALDGDQLCATYERARSAGVRCVVATQSLSNFQSAGGDKLLDAALDNSELLVIHRQAVPDAAEKLAGVGGTEEAWEHTHKVSSSAMGTSLGIELGLDEGERNRRLTDRFRAHPNRIKQLGRGEAVVIATRPAFAVRQLTIRPGVTATGARPTTS